MIFQCPNKNRECIKRYNFEENAIFVWSKDTLIADEVFHRFFACRGKREIYFSSFVKEMTLEYADNYPDSAPFISCSLFINCMMSWIINHDIDYRAKDAICPYCGHNPEVLACDGVRVGVNLKYLTNLQKISTAEKNEGKKNLHRRNTRILLTGESERAKYRRKYVLEYCRKIIRLDKDNDVLTPELMLCKGKEPDINCEITQNLILKEIKDYRFQVVLKNLFNQDYHLELAKSVAQFIICLNGAAGLINFFPVKDRSDLAHAFHCLRDPQLSEKKRYEILKQIKEIRPQFSLIMKTAIRHGRAAEIASFFLYIIDKTEEIHKNDTSYMPDEPQIVDKYDPTTGVSYNFTEHGGQIRKMPTYAMDGNFLHFRKFFCPFMLINRLSFTNKLI